MECQVSQNKSNPSRGKKDKVIEITNREGGKTNSHLGISSSYVPPFPSFNIIYKDLNCKGIFACASCRLFSEC
jgi:hypothetical protein